MRNGLFQFISLSLLLSGLSGCSQGPVEWWSSINGKARELESVEANYHALQAEHERLKKDYFRLENETMDLHAKLESVEKGDLNLQTTGSLEGRSLSSISYEVPKGLRADETLALAYEHFSEQRFGDAAVTFEDLFQRPDAAGVVDASAQYTAGVAWFQLGNYVQAKQHFEDAMNNASGEQREKIHKKVDLWLRAIARKSGLSRRDQEQSGSSRRDQEKGGDSSHEKEQQGGGTLGG